MEIDVQSNNGPAWPYLMFNKHFVAKPDRPGSRNRMTRSAFSSGRFKDETIVVDVACQKFRVLEVLNKGRPWWFLLFYKKEVMQVEWIYDDPVQTSFEVVRDEVCDLIVRNKWHRFETSEQFRRRCYSYKSIREFMNHISYYGKWVF